MEQIQEWEVLSYMHCIYINPAIPVKGYVRLVVRENIFFM